MLCEVSLAGLGVLLGWMDGMDGFDGRRGRAERLGGSVRDKTRRQGRERGVVWRDEMRREQREGVREKVRAMISNLPQKLLLTLHSSKYSSCTMKLLLHHRKRKGQSES